MEKLHHLELPGRLLALHSNLVASLVAGPEFVGCTYYSLDDGKRVLTAVSIPLKDLERDPRP